MRRLSSALLTAALYAAVCIVAYRLAFFLTRHVHAPSATLGALWAAISGLAVLSATFAATSRSARLRLAGAFVGTLITTALLTTFSYSLALVPAAVALTVVLCRMVGLGDYMRLANTAVLIGMAAASQHPEMAPWLNGSLRFAEANIGIASAVALSFLAKPIEHLLAAPRNNPGPV
jgi:uncharacterized membrane protein YgaE (UPF0421/DUF939 family)